MRDDNPLEYGWTDRDGNLWVHPPYGPAELYRRVRHAPTPRRPRWTPTRWRRMLVLAGLSILGGIGMPMLFAAGFGLWILVAAGGVMIGCWIGAVVETLRQ